MLGNNTSTSMESERAEHMERTETGNNNSKNNRKIATLEEVQNIITKQNNRKLELRR